tara:strand:+ start:100 stop:465 length:366 start_codon:yes stop_codon:yes gene_type:complete
VKKSESRLPLLITLLVITLFGGGALAIVWMRVEISSVAKHCGKLEDQREIVSREVQELRGQKSRALRPSTLASMVSGRLSMPTPDRTIYVSSTDMDRRLGTRRATQQKALFKREGEFAGTR